MWTAAIVLAAGQGRRFGGDKLTQTFRGRPLVAWSVSAALESRVDVVVVVVGPDADAVRIALAPLADPRLRLISCKDAAIGMSRSLQAGMDACPDAEAVAVFLGDMPLVSASLADRLLELVLDGASAATPDVGGKPGHPVAIARRIFPRLRALTGDVGGRRVIDSLPDAVRVATDDRGSLADIDTSEDLRSLDCP